MPKVPLCEECDYPVDEDREQYVDVNLRGDDEGPILVHLACYAAWKEERDRRYPSPT